MPKFVIVFDDLFNRPTDIIVNPVNCVGVMGAGLAKQFKARYPDMYQQYRQLCKAGKFNIGDMLWVWAERERMVANFPTKNHWRNPSKLSYIREGMCVLAENPHGLDSVAMPALGCGLGGLNLDDVKQIIKDELSSSSFKRVELVLRSK